LVWTTRFAGVALLLIGAVFIWVSYTGLGIHLPSQGINVLSAVGGSLVIAGFICIFLPRSQKAAKRECPHCGKMQEGKEYPFCQDCGKSLQPRSICFRCNLPVDPKKSHCGNCGQQITQQKPTTVLTGHTTQGNRLKSEPPEKDTEEIPQV